MRERSAASKARQLTGRLKPALGYAGVSVGDSGHGADYWPTFLQNVEGVLARIESP